MRQVITVLLAACLLLTLGACAATEPFDAGTPLTPSEIAALQKQLQSEQAGEDTQGQPTGNSPTDESDIPQNGIVFWLDGGQVYHTSEACYHIAEKSDVRSGTIAEAQAAGKTRACSACAAD